MVGCCIVIGLATGVCFFASQTYSVVDPQLKHRRLAIHESMVGLGCFVGAIGYGLFAEHFGTPWPFAYTPVFIAAGLVVQGLLLGYGYQRQRRLLTASL